MKTIKKILKYIGLFILSLVLFIGLYLLSAFVLSRVKIKAEAETKNNIPIFVQTNGVHAEIVLPVKTKITDWSKKVPFYDTTNNDTMLQYLAFGWGNREFYLETPEWSDLKFNIAFKAIFGIGAAAIHTTFYKQITESKDCIKIYLSENQYARLTKYIENSFVINENGCFEKIITNANYGNNDAFYEAKGNYNLFNTSNTWINNSLKACGQKACLWTPFDKGIFYHYK